MKESLNGSHHDIAKILYSEFGDEFVCASVSGKIWFQFTGHTWEQIEEGIFLRKKISEEITKKFTTMGQEMFSSL